MTYDRDEFRGTARQASGDTLWTLGKVFLYFILPLLLIATVTGFLTRGFGLLEQKTFAPAEEQVRHDVFKESQAYRDGMANEIDKMYLDYQKADEAGKAAIRSVALHRVASYDVEKLPEHLRNFINQLRQAR